MKRILIYLLLLMAPPLSLSGQITRSHNVIRAGDKIVKQQVNYVDPGEPGDSLLWDFSQLKPVNKEYILEYVTPTLVNDSIYIMGLDTFPKEEITPEELIIGVEHYTAYYYRLRDSNLMLLGFENPVTLMHYKTPLLVMDYPFNYGNQTNGAFETDGLYSQESPLGTRGGITVKGDARGRMILPSGDTLTHVVRIKTVQSFLEINSFSEVSQQPMNMTMESYRWYAPGYRYPIFETVHTLNGNKTDNPEFFKTAFFYPPEEHQYLEDDAVNQETLDKQSERMIGPDPATSGNSPGDWTLKGSFWSCHFYPNPVESQLNIVYLLEEGLPVTISLYDMAGQLLKTVSYKDRTAGYYQDTLDCANLSTGNYVCKLAFGAESESHIIIKK